MNSGTRQSSHKSVEPAIRQIQLTDAEAFYACLDAVARDRRYLAQAVLPSELLPQFDESYKASDAALFVAIHGGRLIR